MATGMRPAAAESAETQGAELGGWHVCSGERSATMLMTLEM